jgi:hypothetical protein
MRYVFSSHEECVRVWARQIQEHGRSSGGRVYFADGGRTIYSYGTHFPMAQFRTNDQGERCVIVTTDSYSPSTAKHLSHVRGAVSRAGMPVLYVPDVPVHGSDAMNHTKALRSYRRECMDSLIAADRARTAVGRNRRLEDAQSTIEQYNAYLKFFGVEDPQQFPTDADEATIAAAKAARKQARNEFMLRHGHKPTEIEIDAFMYGEDE